MTTRIRISKIILVTTPNSKNLNIERSHKTRRTNAIVRKMPERRLMKKRMSIKKKIFWSVREKPPKKRNG